MKKLLVLFICLSLALMSFCACANLGHDETSAEKENDSEEINTEKNENTEAITEPKQQQSETEPETEETDTEEKQTADGEAYSGTLKTDTSTPLNLNLYWTAQKKGNVYVLNIELYLEHMSLFVSERNYTLTIGDTKIGGLIDGIHFEEDGRLVSTLITSTSIEVNSETLKEGLSITASYPFRGVYSDVEIESLNIIGAIKLS